MSSSSSALNYITGSTDDEKDFEFLTMVVAAAIEEEEGDTASSKKRYVPRDRIKAHNQLLDDYFRDDPIYNAETFRTRFRLPKELFMKIVDDIEARFEWFQEGYDARGKRSFVAIQKCTSAIRQLAYGNPPDSYDEYLAMSARTSRECLEFFCNAVIILYEKEFLRRPTSHDVALLQNAHGSYHNLPGMLGSLDCTHWEWRMCPTALQGQFHRGGHAHPSIMLEAVASQDLWIWHAYFGAPGANNDINVLHRSPLFNDITTGTAPNTSFYLNGRLYKYGYYLVDGIYPKWAVFVKAYLYPTEPKEIRFKRVQEGARKDVERAFGVLKSKWAILSRPCRAKNKQKATNIAYACCILHNMLIKHDGRAISPVHIQDPPIVPVRDDNAERDIMNDDIHASLRADLTEYLYHIEGLEHLDVLPNTFPDE